MLLNTIFTENNIRNDGKMSMIVGESWEINNAEYRSSNVFQNLLHRMHDPIDLFGLHRGI